MTAAIAGHVALGGGRLRDPAVARDGVRRASSPASAERPVSSMASKTARANVGHVVGGVVLAAEDADPFELEVEQSMAALDLDGELADLDAVPADELARTPAAPPPAR